MATNRLLTVWAWTGTRSDSMMVMSWLARETTKWFSADVLMMRRRWRLPGVRVTLAYLPLLLFHGLTLVPLKKTLSLRGGQAYLVNSNRSSAVCLLLFL